jgi:hypothetical protein
MSRSTARPPARLTDRLRHLLARLLPTLRRRLAYRPERTYMRGR